MQRFRSFLLASKESWQPSDKPGRLSAWSGAKYSLLPNDSEKHHRSLEKPYTDIPRSRSSSLSSPSSSVTQSDASLKASFDQKPDSGHDQSAGDEEEAILLTRRPHGLRAALRVVLYILGIAVFSVFLIWLGLPRLKGLLEMVQSSSVSNEGPRKILVLASYEGQDVSWIPMMPKDWTVHRMMMNDHSPNHYNFTVPRNQGREAMGYLTYIIKFYEEFPDYAVFAHGHLTAWHQPETIMSKVQSLNLTRLEEEKYFSLRCKEPALLHWPESEVITAWKYLGKYWHLLFPNGDPLTNITHLPETLNFLPGGQFAVTREAVHARSLKDWKHIRKPLERDLDEFSKDLDGLKKEVKMDHGWVFGLFHEPLWQLFFGKSPMFHPTSSYCRELVYSNLTTCDYYPETIWDFNEHKKETKCYNKHLEGGTWRVSNKTQIEELDMKKAEVKANRTALGL